jgi:hypothetical protein
MSEVEVKADSKANTEFGRDRPTATFRVEAGAVFYSCASRRLPSSGATFVNINALFDTAKGLTKRGGFGLCFLAHRRRRNVASFRHTGLALGSSKNRRPAMTTVNFTRFLVGAATAVVLASGINPVSAQDIARENVAARDGALPSVGQRVDMPVSLLAAGADAAEVERVLGRPTMSSPLDALGADRFLVYDSEPVRTEVTLRSGHVT